MRLTRVIEASAALMLAMGVAAGAPAASASVRSCGWQALTLLNGWQSEQNAFGTGDPSYCVTSDGMVYLSGSLAAPNGPTSDEFAVLPSYAAPAHLDYLNAYTLNGTLGVVRIDPDGTLHAYSGEASQFTSLAGLSFTSASVTSQGMMPLLNGWQSAQSAYTTGDPAYAVSGGVVHLSGSVLRPSGPPIFGSTQWIFAVLPPAARPTDCSDPNVYTFAGGTFDVNIDPNTGNFAAANASFTSLAGLSYPAAPAAWQPLSLLNGENATGLCDPASSYVSGGVIYLTGFLQFPDGFNGEFAVLPPGARPAHTLFMVIDGDGPNNVAFVTLRIDTDGSMSVFGGKDASFGYFVSLSGLSYRTGS